MSWKIEEAQQYFSDLIQAVEQEPQMIYRQNELVAVVIEAEGWLKLKLFKNFCNGSSNTSVPYLKPLPNFARFVPKKITF